MLRDRFGAHWRAPRRVRSLYALAATTLLAACGGTDDVGPDGVLQPTTTGDNISSTSASTGTTGTTTTGTFGSTSGTTSDGGSTTTAGTTTGSTGTNTGFNSGSTSGVTTGNGTTTGTMGDGGMIPTTNGGSGDYMADPVIPEVTGDCPNFTSGSFSFSGLSGEMEVGPQGDGSGSLLFYWHGTGGQAGNFRSLFGGIGSGNIQKITSQGGIIFSVQGGSGGDTACSGTAVFDGDFSVIDQVVACAVRDHNIDPRRIHSTGCSAGGLQSGCMAMRRADYVASVAPNSGGVVSVGGLGGFGVSLDNSASGNVPATMNMHGGSGDNVIINFGESSAAFAGAITGAGGFAIDCNHMSGHCGAPGDLYDAAIDFLLAHPFGVSPYPYESGLPAGVPSYCEIQ